MSDSYHKIIAFGCSYTSGSELLDHEIHHQADSIKQSQGSTYFYENYIDPLTQEQQELLDQRQRQKVWAAEIARGAGLELDNRALAGSSLAYSVDMIERACYSGELADPGILVLVGVTSPNRGLYWRDRDSYKNWSIASDNMPKHWDRPTIVDFMSTEWLLHQHLNCLLRLVQISDRIQGRLLMFDMMELTNYIDSLDEQHSFRNRWQEIVDSGHTRFDRYLNNFMIDSSMNSDERHGGGHPKASVHAKFARWAEQQIPGL